MADKFILPPSTDRYTSEPTGVPGEELITVTHEDGRVTRFLMTTWQGERRAVAMYREFVTIIDESAPVSVEIWNAAPLAGSKEPRSGISSWANLTPARLALSLRTHEPTSHQSPGPPSALHPLQADDDLCD